MKKGSKHHLVNVAVFLSGVIIGLATYYSFDDLPAQYRDNTELSYVTYNASNNTRALFHLRQSEVENAIEILERDLDSSIITLNYLRQDQEVRSIEGKEIIENKLRFAKKYRLNYPRSNKNSKIMKLVEDALSKISIE